MNGEDGRPSIPGLLALSLAAVVVTSLAAVVVASWDSNNVPANYFILDAVVIFVAFWVDSRAVRAWRSF